MYCNYWNWLTIMQLPFDTNIERLNKVEYPASGTMEGPHLTILIAALFIRAEPINIVVLLRPEDASIASNTARALNKALEAMGVEERFQEESQRPDGAFITQRSEGLNSYVHYYLAPRIKIDIKTTYLIAYNHDVDFTSFFTTPPKVYIPILIKKEENNGTQKRFESG